MNSILIIEDDPTMSRVLTDNFEFSGMKVTTADDGQRGLELAFDLSPDLILLDIMLPSVNGYEICRQLREADLMMPIIMLTAKGDESDVVLGLNLGADDYVTKPFSIQELRARVNAFLRRRNSGRQRSFRFGDWEYEPASHRLTRQGEEVLLTPKEHSLLELFIHNPGRALTREQILNAVWGTQVHVTSRSVDRCVTTLRAKIEPDSTSPMWIKTLQNVGYRFDTS